jgi:hypothetical protein
MAKTSPALKRSAGEVCATLASLFAYMGALALLGILAIHGWNQFWADQPAARPGWNLAERFFPAVAVGDADSHEKSAVYAIVEIAMAA